MQQFSCPFCGLRDEREFFFAAEAGKTRPDTTTEISDKAWADYVHARRNPAGAAREIWVHLPCQEVFAMERNTVTMAVLSTTQLRKTKP